MRATALLLFLVFCAPSAAFGGERRIAVMVGNNEADRTREKLSYAERDVGEMEQVLRTLGGVNEAHVLLGKPPEALREEWKVLAHQIAASTEPVTIFFYYSGHADDRGLLMGDRRFEFAELRNTIENI